MYSKIKLLVPYPEPEKDMINLKALYEGNVSPFTTVLGKIKANIYFKFSDLHSGCCHKDGLLFFACNIPFCVNDMNE